MIISINGIIIVSMINMMMNGVHLQLEVSFDKLVIAAGGDSGEVFHFHKIDIRNKINFHKINMRNKIKITGKLSDNHITVAPISKDFKVFRHWISICRGWPIGRDWLGRRCLGRSHPCGEEVGRDADVVDHDRDADVGFYDQ